MAALYGDECLSPELVEALRRLGHDVVTVRDAGRHNQGIPDWQVLRHATSDSRVVVTANRKDYVQLHRDGHTHSGIVAFVDKGSAEEIAARLHTAILGNQPL